MTAVTEAIAGRLAQEVPALRPLLDEQRRAGLGDALAQMFLDEATRQFTDRAAAGDPEAVTALTIIAGILEAEFGTAPELDELIASSFVPLLPYPGEPGADLVRLLGPKLAAELQRQREWRTPPAQAEFVDRVVRAVPALAPVVEVNRAGNYGDVLPDMFLGDVVQREVENHLSGDPAAQAEVRAVLDVVEAEFGHDARVDNSIAASFIENLPYEGEPGAGIASLLRPKLAAELRRQRPSVDSGG